MNLAKVITIILTICFINISCTNSKILSSDQSSIAALSEKPMENELTIFLLERDIPATIHKLGVVSISVGTGRNVDKLIKQELKIRCRELNANGAYRINDGFYPSVSRISYLVFNYKK